FGEETQQPALHLRQGLAHRPAQIGRVQERSDEKAPARKRPVLHILEKGVGEGQDPADARRRFHGLGHDVAPVHLGRGPDRFYLELFLRVEMGVETAFADTPGGRRGGCEKGLRGLRRWRGLPPPPGSSGGHVRLGPVASPRPGSRAAATRLRTRGSALTIPSPERRWRRFCAGRWKTRRPSSRSPPRSCVPAPAVPHERHVPNDGVALLDAEFEWNGPNEANFVVWAVDSRGLQIPLLVDAAVPDTYQGHRSLN